MEVVAELIKHGADVDAATKVHTYARVHNCTHTVRFSDAALVRFHFLLALMLS